LFIHTYTLILSTYQIFMFDYCTVYNANSTTISMDYILLYALKIDQLRSHFSCTSTIIYYRLYCNFEWSGTHKFKQNNAISVYFVCAPLRKCMVVVIACNRMKLRYNSKKWFRQIITIITIQETNNNYQWVISIVKI
jgi:hypothetical protein